MAKGEKVAAKFSGYVPGMESDTEFEAVSFFREVPEAIRGDIKAMNKFRSELISEISKKYNVKPLGAVVGTGLGRGINRALIQEMGRLAKGDYARVSEKYSTKYPEHGMTPEKVQAICEAVKTQAKDLLA